MTRKLVGTKKVKKYRRQQCFTCHKVIGKGCTCFEFLPLGGIDPVMRFDFDGSQVIKVGEQKEAEVIPLNGVRRTP